MIEAQKGDSVSYNQLLTEISHYLRSYLNFKVRVEETVNDLLQEILLSVHRARHTYDGNLPFKPWLLKIVQSRLIDFYRKTSRGIEYKATNCDAYSEVLFAEAEISHIEIQDFNKVVASLNEDQQKVLYAIKFEGKSIKEVSEEMGMTESAVKVNAHRAYKSLYEKLEVEL